MPPLNPKRYITSIFLIIFILAKRTIVARNEEEARFKFNSSDTNRARTAVPRNIRCGNIWVMNAYSTLKIWRNNRINEKKITNTLDNMDY